MTPEELVDTIEAEADSLISAATGALDADVPSCPGWDLRMLVNHLGRVHRWARDIVLAGGQAPDGFPGRPDEVTAAWFREGVAQLTATLREAGPDAPAWTFLGPGTARFWARRQALETTVHRWDAQSAVGQDPAIGAELAIVGVDEILDLHLPRRIQGDPAAALPTGTLHLHATDDDHGEWIVRSVDGELLVGHGHEKGDAAVRAAAGDLLLWLWGRRDLGELEVFGDADVARSWAALLAG